MPSSPSPPKARRPTTGLPLTVVGDALPGSPFDARGRPRRGGAHHDRRADARRAATRCCRPSPSKPSAGASAASALRRSPRSRPARTSAAAAKTSSAAPTLLEAGRVLRPQDVGVMSSIGLGDVTRRPAAARAPGHHRQRAAAGRLDGRTAFRSPTPTGRCSPRSPSATARSSTSPGWCRDDAGAPSSPALQRRRGHRHRVRRIERRRRGSRADARGRRTASWPCTASRCGRAARPVWAGSGRGWYSCCPAIPSRRSAPTTSLPAARFARSAAGRRHWPYRVGARHARAQDQLADRPPRLRARVATRGRRASSRCRSPARRCSRRRRGPTAS